MNVAYFVEAYLHAAPELQHKNFRQTLRSQQFFVEWFHWKDFLFSKTNFTDFKCFELPVLVHKVKQIQLQKSAIIILIFQNFDWI